MQSRFIFLTVCTVLLLPGIAQGQSVKTPNVEFDLMTWPDVKKAIHEEGMINVIIYNGGVEQRGPQNVNGGHNLMGRETARAIALKMGHTLTTPVIPYTMNTPNPALPGTIAVKPETLMAVNRDVAESLITDGFKNIFMMGDHGQGQAQIGKVAKELDAKYGPKGIHVYYCDEMYAKAQNDYWKWLAENGYPSYGHASIMDTSEMLYLGGDKGWVRQELIKTAVGDPAPVPGKVVEQKGPKVNNGITGDARPSTPELGKRIFDMKVDYAVNQMKRFLAAQQ
jgi:creatinine amidohydrolase